MSEAALRFLDSRMKSGASSISGNLQRYASTVSRPAIVRTAKYLHELVRDRVRLFVVAARTLHSAIFLHFNCLRGTQLDGIQIEEGGNERPLQVLIEI